MKRFGFLIKVRQDKIEEYKKQHQAVWDEMQDALRRHGWRNYSLFMRPDGLVFGYVETPISAEAARAGMAAEEVNTRWQAFMAPLREALGGQYADKKVIDLEEVFHLD